MGLPQNAGITDSAFSFKAEKGIVETNTPESAGIDLLLRYRDDILVLASDYTKFVAWFHKLKEKAGIFKTTYSVRSPFGSVRQKTEKYSCFNSVCR